MAWFRHFDQWWFRVWSCINREILFTLTLTFAAWRSTVSNFCTSIPPELTVTTRGARDLSRSGARPAVRRNVPRVLVAKFLSSPSSVSSLVLTMHPALLTNTSSCPLTELNLVTKLATSRGRLKSRMWRWYLSLPVSLISSSLVIFHYLWYILDMYEREALKKAPPPLFPKKLTNFVIVFSETKPYQTQVDRDKPMNLEFGLWYMYKDA